MGAIAKGCAGMARIIRVLPGALASGPPRGDGGVTSGWRPRVHAVIAGLKSALVGLVSVGGLAGD